MDMEKKHFYMVKRDGQSTTLLCIFPDDEDKVFQYSIGEYQFVAWVCKPELRDILDHRDCYPEYTEITDKEADEIMKNLDEEHKRLEETKHIIHVEHRQMHVSGGQVDIDTYYKEKERCSFRSKELEKLLGQLMDMDQMTIRKIYYSQFDYWGYEKRYDTNDRNDLSDICDNPLKIDGYFEDAERRYRFRYISRRETVEIAKCPKDLNVDLHSVFDDEQN